MDETETMKPAEVVPAQPTMASFNAEAHKLRHSLKSLKTVESVKHHLEWIADLLIDITAHAPR